MPKIIADIREKILCSARRRLLTEGYSALRLREIAADCGIAVGTIYNYYDSKLSLAEAVMRDDWQRTVGQMEIICAEAPSIRTGCRELCGEMEAFCRAYRPTWQQYAASGNDPDPGRVRRRMIRTQLAGLLRILLARFGFAAEPLLPLLAEVMLAACFNDEIGPDGLAGLLDYICRSARVSRRAD